MRERFGENQRMLWPLPWGFAALHPRLHASTAMRSDIHMIALAVVPALVTPLASMLLTAHE